MILGGILLILAFVPLWFIASMLTGSALIGFVIVTALYVTLFVLLIRSLIPKRTTPAPRPDARYLRRP